MTNNITIENPSQKIIKIFDSLKERKEQQIKKLSEKKEGIFSVEVK